MTAQALDIALNALTLGNHRGYSTHYVHYTISFVQSVQASIAFETQAPGNGLDMWQEVRRIRADHSRDGDQEDAFWLASADGNVAVGLMAENRAEEGLKILEGLVDNPIVHENHDIYLENACTSLKLCERFHDALVYSGKALEAARGSRGPESEQVAQ